MCPPAAIDSQTLTHPNSVRNLIRRADRALLGSRALRNEIEAIRHRIPKTGLDPAKHDRHVAATIAFIRNNASGAEGSRKSKG